MTISSSDGSPTEDESCLQCGGYGCVACDARHLPRPLSMNTDAIAALKEADAVIRYVAPPSHQLTARLRLVITDLSDVLHSQQDIVNSLVAERRLADRLAEALADTQCWDVAGVEETFRAWQRARSMPASHEKDAIGEESQR